MLAAQAEEPGFRLRNPHKKQERVPAVIIAGEQRQPAFTGSLARPPRLIIKPQVSQRPSQNPRCSALKKRKLRLPSG